MISLTEDHLQLMQVFNLECANKDVIGGFGFGAEVTGLSTLGLVNAGVVTGSMQSVGNADSFATFDASGNLINNQDADDALSGAWVSQAYLTYGLGNTSFKVGRQELPKSLSPFAFSEGWNVFKNTFEAALIVNTDITDTTLVGAFVNRANGVTFLCRFNCSNYTVLMVQETYGLEQMLVKTVHIC